jgi:hypothetical protein
VPSGVGLVQQEQFTADLMEPEADVEQGSELAGMRQHGGQPKRRSESTPSVFPFLWPWHSSAPAFLWWGALLIVYNEIGLKSRSSHDSLWPTTRTSMIELYGLRTHRHHTLRNPKRTRPTSTFISNTRAATRLSSLFRLWMPGVSIMKPCRLPAAFLMTINGMAFSP